MNLFQPKIFQKTLQFCEWRLIKRNSAYVWEICTLADYTSFSLYHAGYFRDELASFDNLYRLIAALDFLTVLIVLALAFKPKFHMGTKHAELE
ncbi:hypothetical protein HPB48_011125 [Haemaphysalis longicornis]|uniref:Uncharacterized protein n=1 Tax=Haemaphysalis longicornis TaxID=44386 RepID=A0A9J6GQL1_HAELO|nr:hypothetical protein HPB48_011125 [Haemaphysalis longicornis]